MSDIRERAKEHWGYTEGIIRKLMIDLKDFTYEDIINMMEYLYIEAMVHGYKHGVEKREVD